MENEYQVSIKSPKEKSNIRHIKYILKDNELIQVFIFLFYNGFPWRKESSWKQMYGVFRDLGRSVSFKNIKKHLQRSAIFSKVAVAVVFLTLLNVANCPKSHAKITCTVHIAYWYLWTKDSRGKICENVGLL